MNGQAYTAHVGTRLEAIGFAPLPPEGDLRDRLSLLMRRGEDWGELLLALAPLGPAEPTDREALAGALGAQVRQREQALGHLCYVVLVFPFDQPVPEGQATAIKVMRQEDPHGRWGVIPWTADLAVELVDQHVGFPRLGHDIARALTEVPRTAAAESWRRVTGGGPAGGLRVRSLRVDLGYVPVTRLIMATTMAYYLWVVLQGGAFGQLLSGPTNRALRLWGANDGQLVLVAHQQWRTLTHVLLHGGVLHLALNMWALWNVGRHIELVYGGSRMAFIYIVSGVAGGLASTALRPAFALSVGASGAILGLMGALVYFALTLPGRRVDWRSLLGPVGITLAYGFFLGGLVDNYAHVGGFVGGFASAFLAGTPGQRVAWRRVAMAATGVVILGVLAGVIRVPHI